MRARRVTQHTELGRGYARLVRGDNPALAPTEPEYRPSHHSPAPTASLDELFAEMAANDPEFRAWREAEARGRLA